MPPFLSKDPFDILIKFTFLHVPRCQTISLAVHTFFGLLCLCSEAPSTRQRHNKEVQIREQLGLSVTWIRETQILPSSFFLDIPAKNESDSYQIHSPTGWRILKRDNSIFRWNMRQNKVWFVLSFTDSGVTLHMTGQNPPDVAPSSLHHAELCEDIGDSLVAAHRENLT